MLEGSCLCGDVRYRISSKLSDFGYCHCTSCQKASGTAHGANAGVNRANFNLDDSNHFVREFESSPGKFRVFCANCGSPLYAFWTDTPDQIRVRLGQNSRREAIE